MKNSEMLCRIFFPEKCPLCGKALKINEEFCLCCGSDEVRLSDDCCEGCGKERELCSCGTAYTTPLSHITGVFTYEGLVQNMLISFKFAGRKNLYRYFGDCLAERVATVFAKADFDSITFVPSSAESIKERGYNPAQLIAEQVAKKFFIPCQELLVKSRDTEKQHSLRAAERMTNVRGSFSPKMNTEIKGKAILICDDIKTTGATLKECCDILYSEGAKDVYCATVAVTSNLNFFDLDKAKENQ